MHDISHVLVDASDLLSDDQNAHPCAVLRELLQRATAGDLSDAAFRVLVGLFAYADETGFCYPSQQTIANLVGLCERSVRNGVVELEARELLTRAVPSYAQRAERRGASTRYQLAVRPRAALRKKAPARAAGASAHHDPVPTEAPAAPAPEHRHAVPVKVPIPEGEEEEKRTHTHAHEADPAPVIETSPEVPPIEAPQEAVPVAALTAKGRPLTPEEALLLPRDERRVFNRAQHVEREAQKDVEKAARRAQKDADRKNKARAAAERARQGAATTRPEGSLGSTKKTPQTGDLPVRRRPVINLPPEVRKLVTGAFADWRGQIRHKNYAPWVPPMLPPNVTGSLP